MMIRRKTLYDFGLSQDDPRSELKALNLQKNDRILCIASAGEVPLELLVNSHESIMIDAADIASSQLYLSNLKLRAAVLPDPYDAARFLGYLDAGEADRFRWFQLIEPELPEPDVKFWKKNKSIFKYGPVHLGKYEMYINRFAPLGRLLLGGRNKLTGLFDTNGIEEQKIYFDSALRSGLLKNLFKIMFHPKLYKRRGISEEGLIHWQHQHLGLTFYNQFRDFCTNTPARKNWLLQFVFFNRVLFEEALPDYLQPNGRIRLRKESDRLRFPERSLTDIMKAAGSGYYNKYALSNVSDWLSAEDFTELLQLIADKSGPAARGLIRYIHSASVSDPNLPEVLGFDPEAGKALLEQDRFPFYKLIPFHCKGHDSE
jgi:S-adenosylmethionine-diacylglycerol 3-amino-3-carboxypropyl transferase